ncbi:AP endonuclease [Xylariomycetidae sp. FL2044]|nr:AP endonuclease [Xylariomycetidae sp. FL2044]
MPRRSPRKARQAAVESTTAEAVSTKTNGASETETASRSTKRKVLEAAGSVVEEAKSIKKRKTVKIEATDGVGDEEEDAEKEVAIGETKTTKKKKTAKSKIEDMASLAKRTAISTLGKAMYIGAHVSSAGGVQNSIHNAVHIGANAFALFLKSQRKWANPPIAPEARDGFHKLSKEHAFEVHKHCLPHGSYLVNLAQAEPDKAEQAYGAFVDDLQRCESLGIRLYNFHPGNTNGDSRDAAIGRIAAQLNRAHAATKTVVTVLENMAGQGNVIGSTWEDLRDIITLVEDKSRVGVCIDTCHAFAAGHDLRTPAAFEDTMARFDTTVGHSYLRALHLNDSKAPLSSHRDLHANIGTGFLGLRAFHSVMNHAGFAGLPMVLETPIDRKGADGKAVEDKNVWADEIKLLERLIGMDPDGDEFKALEAELHAKGASEREKIQDQVDRKSAKDAKKSAGPKKKKNTKAASGAGRKKKKKDETSDEEGEDSD